MPFAVLFEPQFKLMGADPRWWTVRVVFCLMLLGLVTGTTRDASAEFPLGIEGRLSAVAAFREEGLLALANGKDLAVYDVNAEIPLLLYRVPAANADMVYALRGGKEPLLCVRQGLAFSLYAARTGASRGNFRFSPEDGSGLSTIVLDADKDGNDDVFVLAGTRLSWVRIADGKIRRTEYGLQYDENPSIPLPAAHPVKMEAGCSSGIAVHTAGNEHFLDVQVEADSNGPLLIVQTRTNGKTDARVFRLGSGGALEPWAYSLPKGNTGAASSFRLHLQPGASPRLFAAEMVPPMRAGRLLPRVSMRLVDLEPGGGVPASWSSVYCPTLSGYDTALPVPLRFPVLESTLVPGAKEPFLNFVAREELEFRLRFFRPGQGGGAQYAVLPHRILIQGFLSATVVPDFFLHAGKTEAGAWLVYRQSPQACEVVEIIIGPDALGVGRVQTVPIPSSAEYLGPVGDKLFWLTREGTLYGTTGGLR